MAAWRRNFSSRAEVYFTRSLRSSVIYFLKPEERGFISARSCNTLYVLELGLEDFAVAGRLSQVYTANETVLFVTTLLRPRDLIVFFSLLFSLLTKILNMQLLSPTQC